MTEQSLVERLLPCPLCGEKPKWRGTQVDYRRGIYRLQCLGETHLFQSYGPTPESAAENWNTRHSIASRDDVIEECLKVVDGQQWPQRAVDASYADGDTAPSVYNSACIDIAAAIRDLKTGDA